MSVKKARMPRGEATSRIVAALADEFPHIHDRQSFLDSPALARRFGKKPESPVLKEKALSPKEKKSVARTLGRLISQDVVGEAIYLRSESEKVSLLGAGLVSVSIDLNRLTDDWKAWKDAGEPPGGEPNQEKIVSDIVKETAEWIIKNKDDKNPDQIPLILLDISIVHGSNEFDLLLSILYKDNDIFMKYVREVLQRASCVQKTHTMQIGTREGFPNLGRSAL